MSQSKDQPITVEPQNAHRFAEWIRERGGVAWWKSANLANPGKSWSTPAITDGKPTLKPTWEAQSQPHRIITSTDDIEVVVYEEVKRFRVGIRPASNNPFVIKCTDGATRRIHRALAKAGDGAVYHFDYDTQEAVISRPESTVTLTAWLKRNP